MSLFYVPSLAILLLLFFVSHTGGYAAPTQPFTLWNTTSSHCEKQFGPIDLPDTPARAFVDGDGNTVLVSVDTTGRLSYGPSFFQLTRDCTIVHNASKDSNPANYAANEFLDATYSYGNGTVIAILHDEYPGDNYNNCSVTPKTWPSCWTVSLSLAISQDYGRSWAHTSPPPTNLVAAVPYPYESTRTIFGWGDTGGILRDPRDGMFYMAAYNRMTKGLQDNGTCVMRTSTLMDSTSWRGWNGSDFSVPFTSAYTLPPGTESSHICTVLDPAVFPPPCVLYGYTWSIYLEVFIATVNCNEMALPTGQNRTIFYTTSNDFVHWMPLKVLLEPTILPAWHVNMLTYPALLDATAPSRGDKNYGSIGQTATLTYVHGTQDFFLYGRQLMGVNVTFEKTRAIEGGREEVRVIIG